MLVLTPWQLEYQPWVLGKDEDLEILNQDRPQGVLRRESVRVSLSSGPEPCCARPSEHRNSLAISGAIGSSMGCPVAFCLALELCFGRQRGMLATVAAPRLTWAALPTQRASSVRAARLAGPSGPAWSKVDAWLARLVKAQEKHAYACYEHTEHIFLYACTLVYTDVHI